MENGYWLLTSGIVVRTCFFIKVHLKDVKEREKADEEKKDVVRV